jgi:hypothetical protein
MEPIQEEEGDQVRVEEGQERLMEGENDQNTLHTCIKMSL